MPPEQLLGESYHYSAKSLACLQVGVETALAAKVKAEKEFSAALDQLSEKTGEYQFALDRIAQLEEDNGVLKTQEKKRSATAEKQVGSLAASLKTFQLDLGTEVTEMCQETLDICLDQVSHLFPGVDFSSITLKSQWDSKGRRVYVPQESDVAEESPQADGVPPEQQPEATTQISQLAVGDAAGVSGGCPT
ncbi:hypothetical protein PIB30_017459 [Stylosanthes scabra]|uniref:Uncharacterized protein n=1 Tax=Stylosanthes scabra TaxID=79078 RepID=A0ABU6Y686_9FABA|nr:hypothetical protein [Stylosanthes scabra]